MGPKCKFCGCQICQGKYEPEKQLICESCECYFHIYCLDPPLNSIPDNDWYCSNCETKIILEKSEKKDENLETENSEEKPKNKENILEKSKNQKKVLVDESKIKNDMEEINVHFDDEPRENQIWISNPSKQIEKIYYNCDICEFSFENELILKKHVAAVHRGKIINERFLKSRNVNHDKIPLEEYIKNENLKTENSQENPSDNQDKENTLIVEKEKNSTDKIMNLGVFESIKKSMAELGTNHLLLLWQISIKT